MPDFRVNFTIERRLAGESDYTEVGFGSVGPSSSINHAAHLTHSAIQTRDWETSEGMPDPDEVDAVDDDEHIVAITDAEDPNGLGLATAMWSCTCGDGSEHPIAPPTAERCRREHLAGIGRG